MHHIIKISDDLTLEVDASSVALDRRDGGRVMVQEVEIRPLVAALVEAAGMLSQDIQKASTWQRRL